MSSIHKAINGWGGINSVFQQVISYLDEEDYHYDSYGRDHRNRRHCSYVITVEEELSGLSDYVEVSVSNTSTYVKGLIVSATAFKIKAKKFIKTLPFIEVDDFTLLLFSRISCLKDLNNLSIPSLLR